VDGNGIVIFDILLLSLPFLHLFLVRLMLSFYDERVFCSCLLLVDDRAWAAASIFGWIFLSNHALRRSRPARALSVVSFIYVLFHRGAERLINDQQNKGSSRCVVLVRTRIART